MPGLIPLFGAGFVEGTARLTQTIWQRRLIPLFGAGFVEGSSPLPGLLASSRSHPALRGGLR